MKCCLFVIKLLPFLHLKTFFWPFFYLDRPEIIYTLQHSGFLCALLKTSLASQNVAVTTTCSMAGVSSCGAPNGRICWNFCHTGHTWMVWRRCVSCDVSSARQTEQSATHSPPKDTGKVSHLQKMVYVLLHQSCITSYAPKDCAVNVKNDSSHWMKNWLDSRAALLSQSGEAHCCCVASRG